MTSIPVLQILTYGFALWFGLYLLARDLRKPGLRYAGLGLIAYALGLGLDTLIHFAPSATQELSRSRLLVMLLPGLCWFGAVRHLFRSATHASLPRRPLVLLLTATIFFALSAGLLILPQGWLSSDLVLLAISGDLAALGYAIAALDAYDEGEAFLPDFLRSFSLSLFTALVFSLQMVLVIVISGGLTPPLLLLLLATIATAILLQTFPDTLQSLADRLLLPRLRQERADLRAVASALPRIDNTLNAATLDTAEFDRLTRRALSHLSDLDYLAASPLARLPIIDVRLAARSVPVNTLERAAELKALLTESITRLKPRDKGDFGTTDEWRYYNALYFPYVIGLKPYSRRDFSSSTDGTTKAALNWFAAYVPERTLHNWQNAAARLVAQDLRERVQLNTSSK